MVCPASILYLFSHNKKDEKDKEEELPMTDNLNWRIYLERYLDAKVSEFRSENVLYKHFFPKKYQKALLEYKEYEELKFLRYRMNSYLKDVEEERKRIDEQIDFLNNQIEEWFEKNRLTVLKSTKPITITVEDYEPDKFKIKQTELVKIEIEPLKLGIYREKL